MELQTLLLTDVQPGDGTRYTILVAPKGDETTWIAIGAGTKLQGGYAVPNGLITELLDRFIEECDAEEPDFCKAALDYHGISYFMSHSGVPHYWTAAVGMLTAVVYRAFEWLRAEDIVLEVIVTDLYHNQVVANLQTRLQQLKEGWQR